MSSLLPPEYLTSEERRARITALENQIRRSWIIFAVGDTIALALGILVVLAIGNQYVAGVVIVVATIPCALFVFYWLVHRIQPLQRQLKTLQEADASSPDPYAP